MSPAHKVAEVIHSGLFLSMGSKTTSRLCGAMSPDTLSPSTVTGTWTLIDQGPRPGLPRGYTFRGQADSGQAGAPSVLISLNCVSIIQAGCESTPW